MPRLFDGTLWYRGYHGCRSKCRLRLFQASEPGGPPVALATELEDNPGTSITNRIEHIASLAFQLLERPPAGFLLIEHYQDRALIGGRPRLKEHFDQVLLTRSGPSFTDPHWRPLSRAEVEQRIGGPLEP